MGLPCECVYSYGICKLHCCCNSLNAITTTITTTITTSHDIVDPPRKGHIKDLGTMQPDISFEIKHRYYYMVTTNTHTNGLTYNYSLILFIFKI